MKIRFLVQIKGTVYHWTHAGNAFQVGRSLDCELPLTGPECAVVSGRHARFECSNNDLIVHDLASKNGTYLNSRRIYTPQRLTVGDVVSLGESGPKLTVMSVDGPNGGKQSSGVPVASLSVSNAGAAPARAQPRSHPAIPAAEPPPRTSTEQVGNSPIFSQQSAPPFADNRSSPTRLMLLSVMAKQKRLWWIIGGLAVLLLASVGVIAFMASRPATDGGPDVLQNSTLYAKILKSTAWVVMPTKHGTGAVIDKKNRLIITNYHIIGDNKYAYCVFPAFRDGKLINNADYYQSRPKINGKVLARDPKSDLALIQLEEPLPDHIVEFPLADDSPDVGTEISLVGAYPEGSGKGMWLFRDGKVSQVGENEISYLDGQRINAKLIISNIPANKGDSGSGVVNRYGKLVGVNCGSHVTGKSVTYHIDITEVRAILRKAGFQKRRRDHRNVPPDVGNGS